MLTIHPTTHYKYKKYSLILSRQDLIDNLSWVLNKCRENDIYLGMTKDKLVNIFNQNYNYVYCSDLNLGVYSSRIKNVDNTQYYNAQKLRGDNPELYKNIENVKGYNNYVQKPLWETFNLNYYKQTVDDLEHYRNHDSVITAIYSSYHFDPIVKVRGQQIVDFEITPEYIDIVIKLQKVMQKKVMDTQLVIESNPSSNYLISTFKRYDKHPLINFYNKGLNIEKNNDIQIATLINTDDIGVFSTSLENEYALMACALKESNNSLNYLTIYEWLENIREMSLRYSFKDLK